MPDQLPPATRLQSLLALGLLGLLGIAAAGRAPVIPAPTDLWQWILDGGFFGLLVLCLVAFAMNWVVTAKAHTAAIAERDHRINDLVIENNTLREGRGRSADREDKLADTQELLIKALNVIAQKTPTQAGP